MKPPATDNGWNWGYACFRGAVSPANFCPV